jgi:hypothetical protein
MNYTYKRFFQPDGITLADAVKRSDGAFIPFDPVNRDYQEFLRWCEAGNEPLPPDSQE